MPDDLQQRGGQDRERINVNEPHELRYWSRQFNVSEDDVKAAVEAVGDRVDDVRERVRVQSSGK